MSYLDREMAIYREVIDLINRKEAKGKGFKSVLKKLNKRIKEIEYLKSYN
tara:strand:- start:306 stop:455 length:150 start_codon:yes stop_codon:yes gene_type:complete